MNPLVRIDYKTLRRVNPQAARQAVLEYLVGEHSSLNYQTPSEYLKKQLPEIDDTIRYVKPILLDEVSVKLGPWSGYNVLYWTPDFRPHPKHFSGRRLG